MQPLFGACIARGFPGVARHRPYQERTKLGKAQHYQLDIQSDFSNLATVAEFITNAAADWELDDRTTYNIQMAVDEAVTNVIEHAYRGRSDGSILISCDIRGNEFIVEIQDFGTPFDPKKVAKPQVKGPLSERTVGGLGIYFMKKLMDRVDFSSGAKSGNRVRMVKKIR